MLGFSGGRLAPGNKKPPGWPAVLGVCAFCLSAYALASPAAERCENQKLAKKNNAERMVKL
jgi:hypothetical protein